MIESLNVTSKQVGLEMNLTKTMLMTNSRIKRITVGEEPLNYVDEYIYLGKQISFDRKNNELEVDRRVQITWNKYWSLKDIFKGHLPVGTELLPLTFVDVRMPNLEVHQKVKGQSSHVPARTGAQYDEN